VLIAGAGDRAALRFLEFFTVNILNPSTAAANARAAGAFLRWCERQRIDVQPAHGAVCSHPSARTELRARTESAAARDRSSSAGQLRNKLLSFNFLSLLPDVQGGDVVVFG
jgi:hypothetical protein